MSTKFVFLILPNVYLLNLYRQFSNQSSNLMSTLFYLNMRFTNKESIVYVAILDGEIVGFTQIHPSFSSVNLKKIHILNDLYVDENYRNKDIATHLIKHVESLAIQNSIAYLTIETYKANQAKALYLKNGWDLDKDYLHFNKNIQTTT